MEAAKNAINKLTSNHGQHTTEVSEHYRPAVTHEQVNPTREHETTTVVDKEVHQDHHHTSVLPIQHKEVLPTEHTHNLAATKHSEHHHGDHQGIRDKVAAEIAQFKDRTQTAPTEKTHTVAPTVGSEHHHHHVHETIQPIIQKQTIQPSVVHTTVPIHEVHHNEPKHYTASALPAVSMEEFKSQGGSLTGLADRVERFEGEPHNIAKHGLHGHSSGTHSSTTETSTSQGLTDTRTSAEGLSNTSRSAQTTTGSAGLTDTSRGTTGTTSAGINNRTTAGSAAAATSGLTGTGHSVASKTGAGNEYSKAQQAIDSRVDKPGYTAGNTTRTTGAGSNGQSSLDSSPTTTRAVDGHKPSLLDKLNPFKDADGDGKKGIGS